MEKHTCKLCFRSFGSGRALGGHMRSHVAAATKAAAAFQPVKSPPSESSSSSQDVDAAMGPLGYGLRENPKKSFRLVDPEFSSTFPAVDGSCSASVAAAAGSSVVVQDGESETESSRAPSTHRLRSKRARNAAHEPDPASSVSDASPEEDVAISLMMLSRDHWGPATKSDDQQSEQNNAQLQEDVDDDEDDDETRRRHHQAKGRSKYQCGACKKVFRSYQALGGHRASHKKNNGCVPPAAAPVNAPAQIQIHEVEGERLRHECPVCYRVFGSGQALGGHKRSHLTSMPAATITIAPSPIAAAAPAGSKHGESLIDLNLPAPMEDEADQLSAVSDAGFVVARSLKQS